AVLNPMRREETYPSKNLSGAGVAWKLASALYDAYSRSGEADALLDLVALGMVADVVPLAGENRTLLARALNEFHRFDRPGLRALMDLSKVLPRQIDAQAIGFRLGPRLNAAGRMDKPDLALELLMTRDEDKAQELARHLHQLNAQRQSVETKILQEACVMIERDGLLDRSPAVVVVAGDHWHRGVLGIVAARLVQIYKRSVFLLSREEEIAIGSARSAEGVDLIPLLEAGRPHVISCGGHAGAGGVKAAPDQIEAFSQAVYAAADQMETPSEPPALWADASVPLEQIDGAFMSELKRLEPFGESNEEPLFFSRGTINGMGPRIVGNNHLRMTLR
ncbi:MAG: single-stranded-DNA-specific exonuclease RecJ, partial [Candidatus Hinthialibacter sp.]